MKKLIITIQSNFEIAENILKYFQIDRDNSYTYSFKYDNDDEEEVEAAKEFEDEIGYLLAQNHINFQITNIIHDICTFEVKDSKSNNLGEIKIVRSKLC